MFFGGCNSEFSERNFAHKSEHNKHVLQRMQHSLKEQEKELGEFERNTPGTRKIVY